MEPQIPRLRTPPPSTDTATGGSVEHLPILTETGGSLAWKPLPRHLPSPSSPQILTPTSLVAVSSRPPLADASPPTPTPPLAGASSPPTSASSLATGSTVRYFSSTPASETGYSPSPTSTPSSASETTSCRSDRPVSCNFVFINRRIVSFSYKSRISRSGQKMTTWNFSCCLCFSSNVVKDDQEDSKGEEYRKEKGQKKDKKKNQKAPDNQEPLVDLLM